MNRQELEQFDIIHLAVLCQKVVDNSSMDEGTAARAAGLKQEWVSLVLRDSPPPHDFKTHQQIQTEQVALKTRMVDFLASA